MHFTYKNPFFHRMPFPRFLSSLHHFFFLPSCQFVHSQGMEESTFIVTTQPDWGELSSQIVSLLAITITCCLFGVKTFKIKYRQLTYAKWLVVSLYICSWSFTASSTILGSTNNGNKTEWTENDIYADLHVAWVSLGNQLSCFLSIMACDLFYCGTKMIIYLW